jgi:peptidoglycan/LPS O-acetylase OafA/YrhL
MRPLAGILFVIPLFGPIVTLAAAWASFRWLESPFLRMKDRFAPNRRPATHSINSNQERQSLPAEPQAAPGL